MIQSKPPSPEDKGTLTIKLVERPLRLLDWLKFGVVIVIAYVTGAMLADLLMATCLWPVARFEWCEVPVPHSAETPSSLI